MIYLDSAATTLQKPKTVKNATIRAMDTMASVGRGGHKPAMMAATTVYTCREEIAELFNLDTADNVIFTMNASHSLNIAINSLVKKDTRVLTSSYEHNSVMRPLKMLGADIRLATSPLFEPSLMLQSFEENIKWAEVVIFTHVSNAFGYILPIEDIAKLCKRENVPLIIDASQSAGVINLDMKKLGAKFIAMPGHKGLFGPQGTGVLICKDEAKYLLAGGTGSDSKSLLMPDFLPDMLEAGTHNVTGVAGLLEGVKYVKKTGLEKIETYERNLTRELAARLQKLENIEVFAADYAENQSGVLSVSHRFIDCETLAEKLGKRDVCTRAGLHCSPLAHETVGTIDRGTLRFSVSPFNTRAEIIKAAAIFEQSIKT